MNNKLQSNFGALDGIRILDLTRVLAGPFCTMMLADLGAEVIKIEIPVKGDDTRQYPPFIKGESAYFMNLNRNKKGITINLKHSKGKQLFLDLVKKSDIVAENFKPGTMEHLGLGYNVLERVNKKIVYACISGFGHYGPYKDRPGYDIIGQAMGGLMSVTGWPDSPPTRVGTAIADILGGLSCTIGILAALQAKDKTGEGQKIDIALVDSVVAAMETVNQIYIVEGRIPKRIGNRYEFIYPYDSFKAQDNWFVLGVGNNDIWAKFCKSISKADLINDEKFDTNEKRIRNHNEVKKIVENWASNKKVDKIVSHFLDNGIPCSPIYSIDQVVNDFHIAKVREMFIDIKHPIAGKKKIAGSHIKLSKNKPTIRTAAPLLGQHNEEILSNLLGFNKGKIEELKKEEVI